MHICMIAPEQFTVPGDGSVNLHLEYRAEAGQET